MLPKTKDALQSTPGPPLPPSNKGPADQLPRQTEQNANNALGILLQSMFSRSRVYYENTRVIVDHPGRHPTSSSPPPDDSPVCGRGRVHAMRTPLNPRQKQCGSDSTSRSIPAPFRSREDCSPLPRSELADESDLAATLKTSSLDPTASSPRSAKTSYVKRLPGVRLAGRLR